MIGDHVVVSFSTSVMIDNDSKTKARITAILKDLNRALIKTSMENNAHV